jgi:hypothetical protein
MIKKMLFDTEDHEAKLRELNTRFLEGRMSRLDVENEIAILLNENNLAFRLQNRLLQAVNGELSAKGKERIGLRQYLAKCEEIEDEIIQSEFPFAFFQEATLEEIEALDPTLFDSKTLMLIIIEALKSFVDNEQENDPKVSALHKIYLALKISLCALIPEFPKEDGFVDYLNSRESKLLAEQLKQTGEKCPYCSGTHIQKYGQKKFKCVSCGHYWRTK